MRASPAEVPWLRDIATRSGRVRGSPIRCVEGGGGRFLSRVAFGRYYGRGFATLGRIRPLLDRVPRGGYHQVNSAPLSFLYHHSALVVAAHSFMIDSMREKPVAAGTVTTTNCRSAGASASPLGGVIASRSRSTSVGTNS